MMTSERWTQLMSRMQLPNNIHTCKALFDAYLEKHRHYHTVEHINASLKHLDSASSLAEQPNALELALWFHDAIYKPFSAHNERKSSEWAIDFLKGNDCTQELIDCVDQLIMATAHTTQAQTTDEMLIVDIDLAILGSSEKAYDQFEQHVRQEYRHVPAFFYRRKRKKILKSFLKRERIYHHDFFAEQFEDNARLNLARAIQKL